MPFAPRDFLVVYCFSGFKPLYNIIYSLKTFNEPDRLKRICSELQNTINVYYLFES